jgi:hypothetical protein
LDSQFVIWDIEINLTIVVIEKHALVLHIMPIDTEQLKSHKILHEHGIFVDKEQSHYAIVNEIVLAVAFLICEGRDIIPDL